MTDNYHLSIINMVYGSMAGSKNPPKSAKKREESDKSLEPLKNALFGPAEEEAAVLMGWLPVQAALKADLDAVYKRAQDLTRMARSENTRRSYRTGFNQYETWCQGVGVEVLSGDPGTVALFLSMLSLKVRPTTLQARLAAISVAHKLAGKKLDTSHEAIKMVMRGAAREKGLAPVRQARAIHYNVLPAFVDTFGDSPLEVRNKAILLIGFGGALRRSEIAALELKDVKMDKEGLTLTLPRSKADRLGLGQAVFVARHPTKRLCPLVVLKSWLRHRGSIEGPLFLRANRNETFRDVGISDQTVNRIVKGAAKRLGVAPSAYSGHSLRAGLATSAADAGCDLKAIMLQTRIRSAAQATKYVRDSEARRNSVTASLFRRAPQSQQPGQKSGLSSNAPQAPSLDLDKSY